MSSSNQHSSEVHTISSGSNGSDRELLLRAFSIRAGRVEEEEENLSNFGEEVGTDEGPAWGGGDIRRINCGLYVSKCIIRIKQ